MALTSMSRFAKHGEWPVVCMVKEVKIIEDVATVQWYEKHSRGRWRETNFSPEDIMLSEIIYHSFDLTPLGEQLPTRAMISFSS